MAFLTGQKWYCNSGNGSSTGYYAISVWSTGAVIAAAAMRRQTAPAVASERIFICTIAGTTHATTEPTWGITQGAKTTDNTVTWVEVTGKSAVNGDLTNTPNWTTVKNTAVSQGVIIQRNNGVSYQICTTAGTAGNGAEPSFNDTAGNTTADNTATWTSLGAVGNFSAWGAPWARLSPAKVATVFTANNDTTWVSNNHAETQASAISYTANVGTITLPQKIICVSDAAAPPTALATTGSISTTGANALSFTIGNEYIYGLVFNAGSAANAANLTTSGTAGSYGIFDNVTLKLNNTSVSSNIIPSNSGSSPATTTYINPTLIFGSVSQLINGMIFTMAGGTIAGSGSAPTVLFQTSNKTWNAILRDVDMSGVTGTVASATSLNAGNGASFQNCKIGSGATLASGTSNDPIARITFANCDSTGTNYRYFIMNNLATVQQETTIVRTGSSATNGTTTISWSAVTTATVSYYTPFVSDEISIWNNTTGSTVTITLYLISNTTLNNDDLWAEAEYLGTSTSPLGSTVNSKRGLMATAAALTSDSSTWGGSTNKYKIVLTCTPQLVGPLKVRFYVAKPSVTSYLDPYVYLS